MEKRCDICAFWSGLDGFDGYHPDDMQGVCKRSPPALDLTWIQESKESGADPGYSYIDARHWNQPVTEGVNWCGEFKPSNS